MSNLRIEIMGAMGCGKTTLAKGFAALGVETHYEKVEQNPYLGTFYGNPPKFAFEKDMFFLIDFLHQAKKSSQDRIPTLFDYSLWGSLAYLKAGPQKDETKQLCERVVEAAFSQIGQPALIIYLDCPPEELAKRIASRARSIEENVPLDYLRTLKAEMDKQVGVAETATRVVTIKSAEADLRDPALGREWAQKVLQLIAQPTLLKRALPYRHLSQA